MHPSLHMHCHMASRTVVLCTLRRKISSLVDDIRIIVFLGLFERGCVSSGVEKCSP